MDRCDIPQRCDPQMGERIDRYVVKRKLGEGTFGVVYQVADNNQVYALKILKLWTIADDNDRANLRKRFEHEYKTGQIKSRHLVQAVDYGTVQGNPYLVMEFCCGGDLTKYIGAMKPNQINNVATGILQGLTDLHVSAKVHRDLKPENVLINHVDDALLTDFGVSGDANRRMTETDWMKRAKAIFGTYAYISPEQFDRKFDATILPTTDIFSFGVMFYEMITGQLPFGKLETDANLADYIKNMKKGSWDRAPISKLNASHCRWEEIIDGSLKPNYKDRFQSAKDIIPLFGIINSRSNKFNTSLNDGLVVLRVLQGEDYGMIYHLSNLINNNSGLITIGRHDVGVMNHIPIIETKSCYISRHHATIEQNGSQKWYIRDGQWIDKHSIVGGNEWSRSTNGTYVNSTEVDVYGLEIHPNDIISIGDVKLRVEIIPRTNPQPLLY